MKTYAYALLGLIAIAIGCFLLFADAFARVSFTGNTADAIDTSVVAQQYPPPRSNHFETITRVKDADTYVIDARWSPYDLEWAIRLNGVDAPEKGARAECSRERQLQEEGEAFVRRAFAESLDRVRLRNVKHDKWGGRLDADVILSDGRSLAKELIARGYAKPYNGNGPRPRWCY